MANDNIKTLYNALKDKYNLGSEADFRKSLTNEGNRRTLYNTIKDSYDLGTEQDFNKSLGYTTTTAPTPAPQSKAQKVGVAAQQVVDEWDAANQTYNNAPLSEAERNKYLDMTGGILGEARASSQRANNILEYNKKRKAINVPSRYNIGENVNTVKSDNNTYLTSTGSEYINKGEADFEQFDIDRAYNDEQKKRNQIEAMSGMIDAALNEHSEKKLDEYEKELLSNPNAVNSSNEFDLYRRMFAGAKSGDVEKYNTLKAAQRYMKLSKDMITEADHNSQKGTFGKWIESSFAGGAARGFTNALFDVNTWNFGVNDIGDATVMARALDAFDKGKKITKEQQMLLDAASINLATEAFFGSRIGRGYKAGQVTAESLPFMIEMLVNPASATGTTVASRVARYALKRFGKNAVRKNAKKYIAAKVGSRVLGDIAGAYTMGLTTGALRTAADATRRATGGLKYDIDSYGNAEYAGREKGEGVVESIVDATTATAIENYSEMLGNYFSPLLSPVTNGISKMLGRAASSNLGTRIGLNNVRDFINNVSASKLSKTITDIENRAQWHGVFGEYAEEVAGSALNAILVGDETFTNQYDENGNLIRESSFSLNNQIDTFLGVSLMGGFISGIKTLGYRTPKYTARKNMNTADKRAESAFGNADVWNSYKERILSDDENELKNVMSEIANSDKLTEEQKRAAFVYAGRAAEYRGVEEGEMNTRGENVQDVADGTSDIIESLNNEIGDAYDAGRQLEGDKMNEAKIIAEYRAQQLREAAGIAEGKEDDFFHGDPIRAIQGLIDTNAPQNVIDAAISYAKAKATYDGMIQGIQDEIDEKIESSNALIDSHTNKDTGTIIGATLKTQDENGNDRKVYIIKGNIKTLDDGSIDRENSDPTIAVYDTNSGKTEMISPDAIFSVEDQIDPEEEKITAAESIRMSIAQPKADAIDGKVSFTPGDTYTLTDEKGQTAEAQVIANADGIVDNGDGTVNLTFDGGQTITAVSKDDIQSMVDNTNRLRVAAQMESENQQQAQPETRQYNLNDELILQNPDGTQFTATIVDNNYNDGTILVEYDTPQGRRVMPYTKEQLDSMVASEPPTAQETIIEQQIPDAETSQQTETQQQEQPEVPTDENGNVIYEQLDPDIAWDTLVQEAGDEETAQSIADSMVSDAESNLKKVSGKKLKAGTTAQEKLAEARQNKQAVDDATALLNHWKAIASTQKRRQQAIEDERKKEAEEAARIKKEEEEKMRAQKEEEERIKREALKGVPDFVDDTPQDARARGYRRVNGEKVDRQQSIPARQGREVQVKFDDKNIPTGHVALIEANQLQPSHINEQRNPLHFIDEAQPKERNDDASVMSARRIAANIRPEEITSSVTAYTGAPTVNTRGEVIQGNNRSAALREMWAGEPEQAAIYKQYLADHAADFGLAPEDVEAMQQPVLVNMLDVPDEDAITLGQFVASDTESGGTERIKPKNIVQKMGDDMRSFAGRLLASPDEEMTFSELVDRNGMDVLKWMQAKNYITPTQYRSAFDSKGNLTGEAKNDLKGVMYQSIFQNGNTHLEEMFGALPAKAQKAILATAYRDYDSPNAERLNAEIQNSISAYYALSQMPDFANAKNYKEARLAVEAWKRQYALDDVTGESYLPSDKYSNFALLLATMYKGQTQTFIQNTFNSIFDLVQGTQEATLFEEPDNTPRSLVEAINETMNSLSEELLLNGNFIYNGQRRNNVLAGSGTTGQTRGQGSPGSPQTGGRIEDGTETSNSSDRAANDKSSGRSERNGGENQGTEKEEPAKGQLTKAEAAEIIADMEEHAEVAPEIELTIENWDALFGEDGRVNTPLGEVKMGENQFTKLMRQGRNGKLGMVKPTLENPDIIIEDESQARDGDNTERPSSYVFVKTFLKGDGSRYYYFTSITVSKEGREVVVSSQEKSRNRILRLMLEGSVIWRTPKDATTSSAEKQGLDYAHPNVAEDATKGSGITPQSTSSAHKDTEKSAVTQTIGEKVAQAEAETEQNPTEAQKEAGNYKKGHVRIGQFDITVENPKGSVRRGTDQNGNPWKTTMHNTYGYIRGTEGVDGDHIDVFLTDDIDGWNGRRVYVVDQYNEDGTFDEHKVMLGFNDEDDARNAYFANYSDDWADNRKIVMTSTNLEDFEKWIDSSHRKTKPFAEYKSVQNTDVRPVSGYNIEQRYHKKKDTYIYAVKFTEQMPREQFLSLKKRVKDFGGYYSSYGKGGFIFETEEAGRKFAEAVLDPSGEKLDDNKPLSLADIQQSSEPVVHQVDVEGLMQAINENGEAKLSDHFVMGRPGLTEKATSRQTENQTQETEQQPQQSDNNGYGANNKLVSRDRYEELKKRMRQKLGGQLNMGIDPEILAIGTEMAAFHIEAGARKFADYARHMIDDLGDAIRPYLKSFYNGVRDLPEVQEAGYVDEMTPYDEVRTFDVANFDKTQGNALATAEMVVAEQEAHRQADAAKEQLTNQRNEQRRQEDEQRTADTEAVAGQAEAAASKAESDIEAATDEKQVNGTVEEIDRQLDKVNEQLALLGYYEADQVEGDFNEAYGYMRNAEKKAVKDANNLANRLVKDIGIDPKTIVDKKGKRRRSIATANIAPIGGDISIHLPLGDKRELYISIQLDKQDGDNLKVTGGMLRIENPNPERGEERYLSFNNFFAEDETYPSLLRMVQQLVKRYAPDFVPVSNAQQEASTKSGKKPAKRQKKQDESKIADLFSAQEENVVENQENSPFKKGDAVVYKGKPATVYDIEDNGRLVLDTGLAPVLYESADPKEVKPANTATHNAENTEINRIFANAVKTDMLAALDSGTKPYRSILDLRKRAAALGMEVDNDGRTDILLQELVEEGLVRAAREVVNKHGRDRRESYDLICKLYEMQPTIAARSSNRIKMQQYSTPLPMAWNAAHFAMSGKKNGKVLEPTAGNGMLVFAVPANQVHANELDETRLDNLREQGFAEVTQQDATEPFEGGEQYDVVIANPPFGKREAVNYDGKLIPGLDPQITLNALASMKDDGKAAIIIGGNMVYGSNGGLKSMKPFFTYLYDHYNVKGVVDMDGKLYAKQGTTYPTRMILIDGRRSDEERAQTAVYPPVESKAIRRAESFDDLYEIVNQVLNSKEKTNGTEVLRGRGGQLLPVDNRPSRNTDGKRHPEQPRKDDTGGRGGRTPVERTQEQGEVVLRGEHRENTGNGKTGRETGGDTTGGSRGIPKPDVQRVDRLGVSTDRVGLNTEQKKRTLTEEKLPYRPHNSAFSLESVAPAAMVEAMDNMLTQIETENGNIDEFVKKELGYDTIEELHQALAAEQIDSVAMAIYQMKKGQALIIGDQTGVGKGRQMAALIRWAVKRGEKPVFITQKADLFSDIYRDLVDIGSGDLVPFIFNSPSSKENKGEMVDANGKVVYKGLPDANMKKVMATGQLPEDCDYAVLTYSQINSGDEISQKEADDAAKKHGGRIKKSKASKDGKATPKATFLRSIAEDNYLFLDESHTAAGTSNTGAYLQSILRTAKAATFASATFAKRPDTMPLYAIRTAMSQAKVEPDKMISIIEKGGVTLQEIMSRELTNAGQMVRRERDMSDVKTDWKTIDAPATVKRARENYDRTIAAFNAIIKFQEDYVKPKIAEQDKDLAIYAESIGVKRGTNKLGVENVPFASKTYNYTKQLMLALKVDAIADEVDAEIKAGRHPVIALESTMENTIKDYAAGDIIEEPTFSASLLKGLDTVMQYTVKDENGKETHAYYSPHQLGEAGEKAYYELQDFIRKSTSDIFISPLDAIIERLHEKGYKVGELTGRNMYVERNDKGQVVVKRRTDKDKKKMQREFNNGTLDVLILNKSASTGISLHASEKFSDQRQRTMIIAQPLSDINDYMQMIGRIDRTGQVHRGYYINLGLPVPAENRFLMMLSTKLKSLNANTTTSQDSKSNEVEAPDLLNKYGSQVVVEYLRDNPEIYEKMGCPLKKGGVGKEYVKPNELDDYKPQEDDARKITGYVALLTTKEQEEFYDDVVRRYNELIKYLDDTGSNDLKITVMPLRAKTLEKRISSEGIDPNGKNPFAQNAYVEKVEMDVLRKPMKADEIRKTVEQINGKHPEIHLQTIIETIQKEHNDKIAAEEQRYENSKKKAVESIAKQTEKINRQQKRTADEKREAIATITQEINDSVEERHDEALKRLNSNRDLLLGRLRMFSTSSSYLVPDNLETMMFDFAAPAIFCGYKAKDKKITASTTLAVFATLDGRRRIEVKLSDTPALQSIYKMTNDNWDAARSITLENWDSQIPNETRKQGYILTGNILQAIADTQDERGSYPGQLISYTDIDGNIHDGILMPDKWNTSMLKSAGAPLSARMEQIRQYKPIVSLDGKVSLVGSEWAQMYYLTVPKTKKDGAVYYENETLLNAANGIFYPFHGKLRADIPAKNIGKVVRELTKLGVKVKESNDVVADDMMRSGNGALSDDDLSLANDPVSKLLGKSTRTAAQRRAFAERERQRMTQRVQELAEKLHLDNVDIVTDASTLQGRRAKAKGFYSRKTGRITIVIPNHTSVFDAEQTLLHEAVAHYGLRKLFGTHFDTFLNNVFNNADEDVRARIVELAKKHNWDFATATEEYLASLAENTNFENINAGWWSKIKDLFIRMLHSIGFENFSGVTLSDNELRYILWRSYENLAEPGRYRSILGEAEDIAKQSELKVGNYAVNNASQNAADDLYRDGDPEVHEKTFARRRYEERVNRGMYQTQEAIQDSMLGLKEAMQAILKGEGKKNVYIEDVPGFENAYLGENRLSSLNQAEADAFENILFKPLLKEVSSLAPNNKAREELTDYMMAKHGLERNRVMAERDAQAAYDTYIKKHPNSNKTLQDFIDKYREKDYAGLTALTATDNVSDAEFEAQQMVDAYESNNNTDELWKKTKTVSDAILSKLYDTGMMSKETYDNVRSMYDYYIPLRGFDEKTSEEAYAYLNSSNSAFNAPIKTARGRKSKADDPFAYLQSMAESAIMQGNRNKLVKQRFLNFALNHPSDLVSISDIWLKHNDITDEWEPVFPDNIESTDTAEEVESKMKDFEEKMSLLAEQDPDMYKHGKDAINIPYRVVNNRELHQHQVIARRNGRDYVITINGNPRAAQALNGQTNPDNDISGSIGQIIHLVGDVNRTLSSVYTTLQPDFVASNFLRDTIYANSMVWVKESPKNAINYNANFSKLPIARMKILLAKYRKGNLDMNNETENMFYQFIINGGETGFSRMADIDKHKKEIEKLLKAANDKIPLRLIRESIATWIGEIGRGIEMRARFAAFMTSRNAGRSIDRSIWDAKEISVNFNKKGAGDRFLGATGQTAVGNAAAAVSGTGRILYIFWNAGVQGMFGNFAKYTKRHPAKMASVAAAWFALGLLIPALASSDGDDDDNYFDNPKHVRRQNLIIKGYGRTWIKIPLPIEYRAIYGMGELAGSTIFNNEKLEVNDMLSQVSQLLPIDVMEGKKALYPSSIKPAVDVSNNETWYGTPIWKDTPYNKYMPEWTKAYKSANKDLVELAAVMNELSGGNKYRKGSVDLNPAAIEYLLKQYTGGFFTLTNQILNLGYVSQGQKEFDWRYVPLANRMFMTGADERNVGRGLNDKFFNYMDYYQSKASEFSAIKNDRSLPIEKKAELITEIISDPDYKKMKAANKAFTKLNNAYNIAKEEGDEKAAEELNKQIYTLKHKFISDIEKDVRK